MRADRLLSILMLLQSRGKVTAVELAEELEVSVRTIYRDVNALSSSGVPVYAERGPGGGIALIEHYRSDLTGLTKEEVRALFMVNIPAALSDLGLGNRLRAAMLKLSAALPDSLRIDEQGVQQRILIDSKPWTLRQDRVENHVSNNHLDHLQRALWDGCEIEVIHSIFVPVGGDRVKSILWPYGLVSKENRWYLVSQRSDHLYVLGVNRMEEIQFTGRFFQRPDSFDLVKYWESWCQSHENNRPLYPVTLSMSPEIFNHLHWYIDQDYVLLNIKDERGWIQVCVNFETHEQARSKLLAFGGAVEVLEPEALRCSVKDYAFQILSRYSNKDE